MMQKKRLVLVQLMLKRKRVSLVMRLKQQLVQMLTLH
jgi:hypothetical protein